MTELIEKELVYRIVGCALAVINRLGHGLREKAYERALCVEFRFQGIGYSQQKHYPVFYRGEQVDEFIPDLEIEDKILADAKTIETIGDEQRGQMLNFLRVSRKKVGVILNFKHRKLAWERIVLEQGLGPV